MSHPMLVKPSEKHEFAAFPEASHRRRSSMVALVAPSRRILFSRIRVLFSFLWLLTIILMALGQPWGPSTYLRSLYSHAFLAPSPPKQPEYINYGAAPWTDPQSPAYTHFDIGEVTASPEPAWQAMRSWNLLPGKNLTEQQHCLTWAERYAAYQQPLPASLPVPPTLSTTALMVRIRPEKLFSPINHDTLLYLRSTVQEIQMTGIDTYFVVNIPKEWDVDEEWRHKLDPEFANRVLSFVWEDWVDQFLPGTFRDMVYDNHVSSSWFYNSTIGQQYSFLWWLEDDVRQTGSWSSFFNHLNASTPATEPAPYWWETRNDTSAEATGTWTPDLYLTWLHHGKPMEELETVGPGPKCADFARIDEVAKAFIMLIGYSRKLHDITMDYYKTGHSCFCEDFLVTVAKRHHLPIFDAMVPSWRNLDVVDAWTWGHWQEFAASPYYYDWRDNPEICRPGPAILHKVVHA